jgi:capsid portal protein
MFQIITIKTSNMEKDKITVSERLIDFGAFLELEMLIGRRPKDMSKFVDGYLKSINQSSGEALTLAPIEQQEKVCSKCGAPIKVYSQEFCSNDECDYSHP